MIRTAAIALTLGMALAASVPTPGFATSPVPDPIEVPESGEAGVFITQIGSGNVAEARQAGNRSRAQIVQDGDANRADVDQRDSGEHHVTLVQSGDENRADILQQGLGRSVLLLAQEGTLNRATIVQGETGDTVSAAAISQSGSGNTLILAQNGSDNQARLMQRGEENVMTATQLGNSNRLVWEQDGTGLSDLQITQDGGAVMQVTQTNLGGPGGGG